MHLTPGVVDNFPKAVGVEDFCPLCTKRSQIPIQKEKGATPGILVSRLNNRWKYTIPGRCGRTALRNTKYLVKHTNNKKKKFKKKLKIVFQLSRTCQKESQNHLA